MGLPMKKSKQAAGTVVGELLYCASSVNADIRWLSRFSAGDPFVCLRVGKKITGVVALLEVNRAREEGAFHAVLNLTEILADLRKRKPDAGIADVIVKVACDAGVTMLRVPDDFSAGLLERIRALGAKVEIAPAPFFPERVIKDDSEVAELRKANKASVAGFKAVEAVLKASVIKKGFVHFEGKVLTSERLHLAVNQAVLTVGASNVEGPICAAGLQAVDCHNHGSGPIKANELIVVDIYPRLSSSGYCGDMTRTYLKGKASPEQRKLVAAVKKAYDIGMKSVKPGVTGAEIHKKVADFFEESGYKKGVEGAYFTGFFHGLGHGVGLQVHEEPSVSPRGSGTNPLKAGMAITIEPGLYYPGIGACRIEDSVLVTKTGGESFAGHHFRWEIA